MDIFVVITILSFIQPVVVHLIFLVILSMVHKAEEWFSDGSTKINDYHMISPAKRVF